MRAVSCYSIANAFNHVAELLKNRQRGRVFADRSITTAIPDRLLHHAVLLNIRSNSHQLKENLVAGLLRSEETES